MSESLFKLSLSQMKTLPPELIAELNLKSSPCFEEALIELMELAERPLSASELTIGLYKKYGHIIESRKGLVSKLNGMKKKRLIWSPRSGQYCLMSFNPKIGD